MDYFISMEKRQAELLAGIQALIDSVDYNYLRDGVVLDDQLFEISTQGFRPSIYRICGTDFLGKVAVGQRRIVEISNQLRILRKTARLHPSGGAKAGIDELINELKGLIGDIYKRQLALIEYLESRLSTGLKAKSVLFKVRHRIAAFLRTYFSSRDQESEGVFLTLGRKIFYHYNWISCTIKRKLYVPLNNI